MKRRSEKRYGGRRARADVVATAEILSYFNQLPAGRFDLLAGSSTSAPPKRPNRKISGLIAETALGVWPTLGLYAALSFWSTATSEGFRRRFAGSRHDKELDDRGTEGIRNLFEYGHSRVLQSPFQTAYVSSIDPGVGGESLLGQAPLDPEPPEISRHKRLRSHAPRRTSCGPLNHGQ